MADVTGASQVEVLPCEDKNRSVSRKRMKRLEAIADDLESVKQVLDVLKEKDGSEGEENKEADANEEVDELEGDANDEEFESEGDEEEEDGSEGDVNEEEDGSEGDGSEEEDGSEGVQKEEDMNGGDGNKKLDDGANFEHEQKVEEGAERKEKGEALVTELVTEEGNINGDGGKGEMVAADVSVSSKKDKAEMVKKGKNAKNSATEENIPIKKAKQARRRHKTTTDAAASKEDNKSDDLLNAGKKEALAVGEVKMADGMGLIFMCNSKTKQDCFRYKILGLPASKKELVAKIYKGMRLFLFDVDLKLMHGIFKAAAPGGYNIEPEAFKSAYPAQVRFRVLNDCLPLPEEKFKVAIRENYYGRKKFSNQLSSEQVKKLCKIFQTTSKLSKKKRPRGNASSEIEPAPPLKRPRRANGEARTGRPEPKSVQRAADAGRAKRGIRARPVLVETSSHGRGRDSIKHREAHKRSRHERGERRRSPSPAALSSRRVQREATYEFLPHRSRARDLDPYAGGRREIHDLPPPRRVLSPPLAPHDYYYIHDPPLTRHSLMVDPRSHATMRSSRIMDSETARHLLPHHDSHITTEYHHRDALSSMYREPHSLYHASSAYAAPARQNAYAPPPPSQSSAYAHPPLYYRY